MVSKDEEDRLRKVFEQLDEDGNGTLEYQELLHGLTNLYGEEYAKTETDRMFKLIDTDNNGTIEFTEYL